MLKRKISMKHNSKIRDMLVGWNSKCHPIFGVVSLTPKDWPCNCVNTPDPGAASIAAFTSPMKIEKKKPHTQKI